MSGPALSGDTVYFDRGTGSLSAFRAADGTLLWTAQYGAAWGDKFKTDMLVTDRHIYAPAFGNRLFIFDRFTGRNIATLNQPRTRSGGAFAGPAAAANGKVYVGAVGVAWSFDEPR